MTHEAQDSKWHKKHPEKCRCYGASGDGDGRWHFHCPQEKCTGICSYIVNEKKHKVATSDPADESFTAASADDHTTATSGSYCGCECGDYYAYTDGDGNLVVPEGKTQPPADSKLHRFAESGSCKCYCGAKERPSGDDDAASKHKYASDDECKCECGRWHRKIQDENCPNVCGGSCNAFYKAEDFLIAEGESHEAVETNHTHVAEVDKCGCKCGKYGTEEGQTKPSKESIDLHGFSQTDGETCKCECQNLSRKESGKNFEQRKHQFLDEKCVCECQEWHRGSCNRVDDCTNICKTVESNVFGGKTHLAQDCKVDAITEDQESDHTPLNSNIESACGCKCFKYFNTKEGHGHYIKPSSGSALHIFHEGKCKCNCQDETNPDPLKHGWSDNDSKEYPCICDCGKAHNGSPDVDCPGVCSYCGRAVDDTDGENLTEAAESDHTPKTDGCGCKCGKITSDTETDSFHHNADNASSCKCECEKKTLEHKYPNPPPQDRCYSCYCGTSAKRHVSIKTSCNCQCGEMFTGHKFADDKCECYCGDTNRRHIWEEYSESVIDTYTCSLQNCGNTISVTKYVCRCSRCGELKEFESETGHATDCNKNKGSFLCTCDCVGCVCSACTGAMIGRKESYGSRCTTCGRICHEAEGSEGGGSGGETGGSGGLDDI